MKLYNNLLKKTKQLNTIQIIAIILISILFIVYLSYSLKQFNTLNTYHPRDFAQEANPITLTLFYGKFMGSYLDGMPLFLQTHVSIVPFIMLPFIAVLPYVQTFIIIATLLIFIGAYFIYKISLYFIKSDIIALLSSLLYCVYVPLQYNVLNDWRYNFFYIPIIVATFYFYIKRNYRYFLICFILTILTRDEGIFVILMYPILELLNAFLLKKKKELALFDDKLRIKQYIVIPILSIVAYFFFISFLLKKLFIQITGYDHIRLFLFSKFGDNPIEVAIYMITHPFEIIKEYVFNAQKNGFFMKEMFLPLLFLPFIGFQGLILALPTLFLYLLFDYPDKLSISSPYSLTTAGVRYLTFFLSYFIIATILAIRNMQIWIKNKKYFQYTAVGLLTVIIFINLKNSPMPLPFSSKVNKKRFSITPRDEKIKTILKKVKRTETITTQFDYLAYYLNRKLLGDVNHVMQFNYELIPLGDNVFIDLKKRWFFNVDNFFFTLWRIRNSGKPYYLIDIHDGAFLLSRDSTKKSANINATAKNIWQFIFSQRFSVPFYDKYTYVHKEEKPENRRKFFNYKNVLQLYKPAIKRISNSFLIQIPLKTDESIVFRKKSYHDLKNEEFADNIELIVHFTSSGHYHQLRLKPVCPLRFWDKNTLYLNDILINKDTLIKGTYTVSLDIIQQKSKKKEEKLNSKPLIIGQIGI